MSYTLGIGIMEAVASETSTLSEVEEAILDLVHSSKQAHEGKILVVLEGGHFSTTSGADEFTINSQQSAFKIADQLIRRFSRNMRIVFGVLADDLGQVCSAEQNVCIITPPTASKSDKAIEIPVALYDVLKAHRLFTPERLILLSEKTARNRGIKWLREYVKDQAEAIAKKTSKLSIENEEGLDQLYFTASDGQSVLVADMISEWRWASHCPLIMAQHYFDLSQKAKKFLESAQHQIIIDFSFIDDRNKVCKGAELSLEVYPHKSMEIINVCFGDDTGTIFTIDQHERIV